MQKWRESFQDQQAQDMAWGCALASQLGFVIAGPVLIGLGVGYWLDLQLGTLPWIALVLTVVGTIAGPIIAYRRVTRAVGQRFDGREQIEKENLD